MNTYFTYSCSLYNEVNIFLYVYPEGKVVGFRLGMYKGMWFQKVYLKQRRLDFFRSRFIVLWYITKFNFWFAEGHCTVVEPKECTNIPESMKQVLQVNDLIFSIIHPVQLNLTLNYSIPSYPVLSYPTLSCPAVPHITLSVLTLHCSVVRSSAHNTLFHFVKFFIPCWAALHRVSL